jgi:hypothetical protein
MDAVFLYSGVRQGRRVGIINSREFRVKLKVSSITMSKPYFMKIHKSLQKLSGGTDVEARTLSHQIHFRIRRWHKNIFFPRKDLIRRCVIVATALMSLNSLWIGQDYSVMFVKLGTISGYLKGGLQLVEPNTQARACVQTHIWTEDGLVRGL